jgi:hypothetical protein
MLFNLEMFWRHFIDGVGVEDLEEWVRSSMATEAVSEVARPPKAAVSEPDAVSPPAELPADDRIA